MRISLVVLVLCVVLTGCAPNQKVSINEDGMKVVETIERKEVKQQDTFTYLQELSKDKLAAYANFKESGNIRFLQHFTPEELFFIYMELVAEHELERIYTLTYNGGKLPEKDAFIAEYNQSIAPTVETDYLIYRYYDAVSVDTNNSTDDKTIVNVSIAFGNSTYGKTFVLLKEDDIWKMDVYYIEEK